eukprot:1318532-Amorphochlora_amoeboformis.AAC.1
MPSKEKYGAQPPIELLRQFMDYGGWYNRKVILAKKSTHNFSTNTYLNPNTYPKYCSGLRLPWYPTKIFISPTLTPNLIYPQGPPTGGRNHITERYMRHYAIIGLVEYSDVSLKRIYGTIVNAWIQCFVLVFGESIEREDTEREQERWSEKYLCPIQI